MEKIKYVIIFLLMDSFSGNAQFRFGGEAAFYFVNFSGVNELDSIVVNGTASNQGELFISVFAEQTIRKNLEILGSLSIKPVYPSFVVYNAQASCTFCPVQKVKVLGVTNIPIEILPQLNIPLVPWLKTRVFFGTAMNFNVVKHDPDVYFDGKYEGVVKVINALERSIKPFNFALIYGGSLEFKNVTARVRVQLKSAYTRKIMVSGVSYDFKNNWQFISFSLGYTFQTRKNKVKHPNTIE